VLLQAAKEAQKLPMGTISVTELDAAGRKIVSNYVDDLAKFKNAAGEFIYPEGSVGRHMIGPAGRWLSEKMTMFLREMPSMFIAGATFGALTGFIVKRSVEYLARKGRQSGRG